jgi:hypothetical protein
MDLKESVLAVVGWICLTEVYVQWQTPVNTAVNLCVLRKARNFLTTTAIIAISFSMELYKMCHLSTIFSTFV